MKKLRVLAVICIIAMLFVACDTDPGKKEEAKPFAPEWAIETYEGSVTAYGNSVESTLTITDSLFDITVTIPAVEEGKDPVTMSFSSGAEGVSYESDFDDNIWNLTLKGITLALGDVKAVITCVEPNSELSVELTVPVLGEEPQTVTFKVPAAETPEA